ncbi:hypothetical protein MKS88_004012 [Plasmodium brasilianum]|uniref:Uncharacterized protein n=1 Tax=Plasmodium brasilianum TaxID=5824 RepID=A0ACB9Y3M8_PLABR|nr:hypothetical protein MKS88_004012 [Plasmodium brasilianum]
MEQNFKFLIFIYIALFILLICIYHFDDDVRVFYISLDENYKHNNNLNTKNYRLLVKCEHIKESYIVRLNEGIPNNALNEKKEISNNEKIFAELKSESIRCLSKNMEGHRKYKYNNSCIFVTKRYSRMEKKTFKELD